jgi:uncharacterized OB-fold protein
VKIDKTDGGLIHRIGEIRSESLKIGTKVTAVFEAKKNRKGALTDIKHFKPA